MPPFVYSEKILEYVGKYEALMEEQRKYVRSLKAPYHEIWYPNIKRKPGKIFETDPVHMLGGIGKPSSAGDLSAKESFFHLLGLKTVADVKLKGALQSCSNVADVRQFVTDTLPPDTVPAKKKKFFSTDFLKCLLKAKTQGADSLEGSPPSPRIDYRKLPVGECPYVAKYGEVEGLLKLKVDVKKKKNACDIRDYCLHMVETARKAYAGTAKAESFRIYHDALQQFTDAECITWLLLFCTTYNTFFLSYVIVLFYIYNFYSLTLTYVTFIATILILINFKLNCIDKKTTLLRLKAKNLYHYFIFPVMGCNDGTSFAGRPIGDSPEFNNLDSMLFADFVHAMQRHCAATRMLDKNDARKFDMRTPLTIGRAVDRLWDPNFITSKRIMEDSDKIYDLSMPLVLANFGKVVEGCGDRRSGKRAANRPVRVLYTHGGNRTKGVYRNGKPSTTFHQDAIDALHGQVAVNILEAPILELLGDGEADEELVMEYDCQDADQETEEEIEEEEEE